VHIYIVQYATHWALKQQGSDTTMPKSVCESEDVTVLQNQEVHIGREVVDKRADIIIKNRKEKTCILIDVAIPADRNVI
jgi:hypothetical protein